MAGTMNLTGSQKMAVTALGRGQAAVFAEGSEMPALVEVPLFRGAGAGCDADVHEVNTTFYRSHPHVMRPMPGCQLCNVVCHYAAWGKRLAARPTVPLAVWGYALSCLDGPFLANDWESLCQRLLPRSTAATLQGDSPSDLAWCILASATEDGFWMLRERGVSLATLNRVTTDFAAIVDAARCRQTALKTVLVGEFRQRLGELMRMASGPWPGCRACARPCCYEPLGQLLAQQPKAVEELHQSLQATDGKAAVREVCRRAAKQAMFSNSSRLRDEVAMCMLTHVLARISNQRIGPKDPGKLVEQVFCASETAGADTSG
jgi:hypothetical protein